MLNLFQETLHLDRLSGILSCPLDEARENVRSGGQRLTMTKKPKQAAGPNWIK